jgi:hypothetical protein
VDIVAGSRPCECPHTKDAHAGGTYACRYCDCKRYTPDIQAASKRFNTGEGCEVPNSGGWCVATGTDCVAACQMSPSVATRGESTSARLRRVEQERGELLSIVARIGDALSPTGERPQEALGTLVADVEAFVALHDVTEAELVSARAELQQLRAQLAERGTP